MYVKRVKDKFVSLIKQLNIPTRGGRMVAESITATSVVYFYKGDHMCKTIYAYDLERHTALTPINLKNANLNSKTLLL